ncbi:MAG: metallopeptidase family protein [Opitutales bacterium]|nr:metallopeptidase family protein [Opitutales bacterium]
MAELERVIAGLPQDLRALATKLPVICQGLPGAEILGDSDLDEEILGLFCGCTYAEASSGEGVEGIPSQIYLYLENIWDYSGGDPRVFRRELRKTYLHELGHYLGYDEEDLDARGMG